MAGRKRNTCTYHPDHRHRYAWRHVYGKGTYACLCGLPASERVAERLAGLEAETAHVRAVRWGQEQGEQTTMQL